MLLKRLDNGSMLRHRLDSSILTSLMGRTYYHRQNFDGGKFNFPQIELVVQQLQSEMEKRKRPPLLLVAERDKEGGGDWSAEGKFLCSSRTLTLKRWYPIVPDGRSQDRISIPARAGNIVEIRGRRYVYVAKAGTTTGSAYDYTQTTS